MGYKYNWAERKWEPDEWTRDQLEKIEERKQRFKLSREGADATLPTIVRRIMNATTMQQLLENEYKG